MALRDKLASRMQPFCEPGENIQQVLIAQSGPSPYWLLLTGWVVFFTRYRVIAVTDRAIVVAGAPWWMTTKPRSVIARLPRATVLGPVSGLWGGPLHITPNGKKSWVHKRFQKDVAAADADLQRFGIPPVAFARQGFPGSLTPPFPQQPGQPQQAFPQQPYPPEQAFPQQPYPPEQAFPQQPYPPEQAFPQQPYPPEQAFPQQPGQPQQAFPQQPGQPQQAFPQQPGQPPYPQQQPYPPQGPPQGNQYG